VLSIILILVILVAGLAMAKAMGSANRAAEEGLSQIPYLKKEHLFNETEKSFYKTMNQILQVSNYCVFVKVPLLDLLVLPRSTGNWVTHWNRVKSKHLDFVVCDKEELTPLVAISLETGSSDKAEDVFLQQVLEHIKMPYIKVEARETYDAGEITRQLGQVLSLQPDFTANEAD